MFNSGILDVVIGLIFVYLTLSLIVTAVNEFIEALLKKRASDLETGLRELLNDPKGIGLVKDLYEHQLVFGLFKGKYEAAKTRNLPSYIPARNFALALMDVVIPDKKGGAAAMPLADLRSTIATISNDKVKQALLPLVDSAGTDIDKARDNIEAWYNSSMERVGGWYKRRVQWIGLLLGLVVAAAFNADTIAIGSRLSYDVAMRDSLVAASQEYAKSNASTAQPLSPTPDATSPIEACNKDANSPECKVAKNMTEIRKLGLPIGWDSANVPNSWGALASKALGLLLTGLAISLGAPFWFDLLNKFMVARSTLKPKDQSAEQ
jgi:hypothetical protein